MKRAIVMFMVIAVALAIMWPTAALQVRAADARPEAVAVGGALLVLASILRNLAGRVKQPQPSPPIA